MTDTDSTVTHEVLELERPKEGVYGVYRQATVVQPQVTAELRPTDYSSATDPAYLRQYVRCTERFRTVPYMHAPVTGSTVDVLPPALMIDHLGYGEWLAFQAAATANLCPPLVWPHGVVMILDRIKPGLLKYILKTESDHQISEFEYLRWVCECYNVLMRPVAVTTKVYEDLWSTTEPVLFGGDVNRWIAEAAAHKNPGPFPELIDRARQLAHRVKQTPFIKAPGKGWRFLGYADRLTELTMQILRPEMPMHVLRYRRELVARDSRFSVPSMTALLTTIERLMPRVGLIKVNYTGYRRGQRFLILAQPQHESVEVDHRYVRFPGHDWQQYCREHSEAFEVPAKLEEYEGAYAASTRPYGSVQSWDRGVQFASKEEMEEFVRLVLAVATELLEPGERAEIRHFSNVIRACMPEYNHIPVRGFVRAFRYASTRLDSGTFFVQQVNLRVYIGNEVPEFQLIWPKNSDGTFKSQAVFDLVHRSLDDRYRRRPEHGFVLISPYLRAAELGAKFDPTLLVHPEVAQLGHSVRHPNKSRKKTTTKKR